MHQNGLENGGKVLYSTSSGRSLKEFIGGPAR